MNRKPNVTFEIALGYGGGAEFDTEDLDDTQLGNLIRAYIQSAARKEKDVRIEIVPPVATAEAES